MDFIPHIRRTRISSKLLAMVIFIVIAFAVVVIIVGWSFSSVKKLVTEVSVAQVRQISETSRTVQDFSNLFSRIDMVRQTFFERDESLKDNGYELLKDLQQIETRTADARLQGSLHAIGRQLSRFLAQCAGINRLLAQRRLVDAVTNQELNSLEELISRKLIDYTKKEADTYYLDQTLSLVTGYRENLLIVGKMHAEHFYAHMGLSGGNDASAVIRQLDDLSLRLQTLTAAAPEIAAYARRLSGHVKRYLAIEQSLESSLKELDRRLEQLRTEQKSALARLAEIDRKSIQATTLVAGTIGRIVSSAEGYVFGVAAIVIVLTTLLILFIIRSGINRPLKKIISEIGAIKEGSFRPDATFIRSDEWGVIERALKDMHRELESSSTALRESEYRFRSIFNSSPIAIGIGRINDGRLVDVNDAWLQLFGLERDEVIDRTTKELNLYLNAEERNELIGSIADLGLIINKEVQMRRKSGDIIVTQYSAQLVWMGKESLLQVMMTDITKQKRTEEKLYKKNADMEQFIYTISHDLRSPLVTVKTFLGFLENDMNGGNQERVVQDLQFIHAAADRMKMLLDELLELSRIDRVEMTPVRVSLMEVLTEVLDAMAGVINERKVDIRLPDTDLMLFGERPRLCQIWQNLIENAIKYSHDDRIPRIELGMRQMDEDPVFFVKDNGIGIDPHYQGKIFNIFEKLDPKSPGAGLGLSMIQRIIDKGGGRIWIESEGNGQGSCFFFTLPQMILQSDS